MEQMVTECSPRLSHMIFVDLSPARHKDEGVSKQSKVEHLEADDIKDISALRL